MDMTTIIVLRSLERILGVLIGGGLAWLGFRLFLDVTAKADGSGKFVLPGGTAIHLTRVGPGVFFSLFGTAIVLISFLKPVEFSKTPAAGPAAIVPNAAAGAVASADAVTTSYSGAVSATMPTASTRKELRGLRRNTMALLNRIESDLKPNLDSEEKSDVSIAVPQIKLALMETMWDKDWGDFPEFIKWVNSGRTEVPKDFQAAANYFNAK